MKLHLDFETKSKADLTKVGAWAYASHPSTDIICMGLAGDDEGEPACFKHDLVADAAKRHTASLITFANRPKGFRLVAHNVQFEYAIYHFVLHKKYGWPELLDPQYWDCTMARAYMCGLPGTLEGLALALKLPFQKDLEGKSALMKICKPRADGTFNEDPALYERVYRYNPIDVKVERAADHQLPDLPPYERRLFEADLRINRRGLMIDLGAARKATEIAAGLTDDLNAQLRKMTGGAVTKASGVPELKRWVAAQGVKIPTTVKIDKETNEETIKETMDIEAVKDLILDPETPKHVLDVLKIRQQVGKSSVAKFKKMLQVACGDGRARGMFQYHGAHTGRWAGRLMQPTNFPQGYGGEDVAEKQEFAIKMLDEGAGFFRAAFADKSMQTLTDITRAAIIPAPGKVFVGGDLNAIECRVLNWLAGETWVMNLFARGESPYIRMAEVIFEKRGLTKKGNPFEYDIGKRNELGDGFGMGWKRAQANIYTETSKKGEGVWISDELAQRGVSVYRETHTNVVAFWYATEAAAINAVRNPGQLFPTAAGRILWGMSADRRYLCAKLPSGRLLRYFMPTVQVSTTTRCQDSRCPHVLQANVDACPKKRVKDELRYWTSAGEGAIVTGCNGFLGQYRTWGGELVENVVQAAARDFMVHGLLAAEATGNFPIVLHNYDELLAEVDEAAANSSRDVLAELLGTMTEGLPSWTAGCPVKAEGFIGRRYRK